MSLAYKFTRPGAIGFFTGFSWPKPSGRRPGDWVEARSTAPCLEGIHACRPHQLPYWVAAELWEMELDGEVTDSGDKLVARRGRLLRPVDAWMAGEADAFARDCTFQVRDLAVEVLTASGHATEAEQLAGCPGMVEVRATAASVAERTDGLAALVTGYASDAAGFAVDGVPAFAAHIAALAAGDAEAGERRIDLRAPAYLAERTRQGNWMVEHLGLVP